VAFSLPNGDRLASAGADRTVRVWDVASGRQVLVLAGHLDGVNQVAFSPDGAFIASVSDDRTLRLWDARTGAPLAILRGDTQGVGALAFAPGGGQISTGSDDGSLRVWDVTPPALRQAGLIDLGAQASDAALAWARAASFEPLSSDARRQLGLRPASAPRTGAGREAAADAPQALAKVAANAERRALAASTPAAAQAGFAQALCDYALAAIRAEADDWPDDRWRGWRYRRASLARLLAARGALGAAASAYGAAERSGRCPS
jgi:hypothetical protein